jgi:ubiquinone biosynthesis protein COQ9
MDIVTPEALETLGLQWTRDEHREIVLARCQESSTNHPLAMKNRTSAAVCSRTETAIPISAIFTPPPPTAKGYFFSLRRNFRKK